jgi:16S rRNA (guanine(966)-N(2))-methyltransferase RsmD
MRIIAGRGKGRRLKTPSGARTRPTGGRVKQSLFDILAPRLPGCRFLDLFAGSGAVGLEALSRGAGEVVFVDEGRTAIVALRQNLQALRAPPPRARALQRSVGAALDELEAAGAEFDLVFLDPPYESALYEPVLARLAGSPLLAEGAVVIAEHFHKRPLAERIGSLVRRRETRIGDHRLTFYGRAEARRND